MIDWAFPLRKCDYNLAIPTQDHPGSFGAIRRHDIHTGVDLYCEPGTPVFAVEDGVVIAIEVFTGPRAESPWWHETLAILVEGKSGVVCYGEVENLWVPKSRLQPKGSSFLQEGEEVRRGEILTWVKQVLKKDKGKPMCMLHLELYKPGTEETVWWRSNEPQPDELLDPTEGLLNARASQKKT